MLECRSIINNELMLENYIVDKENNANLHNQITRKQKYQLSIQHRPATPILETTFNPLPKIKKCSIPVILSKQRPNKMHTIDYQHLSINHGASIPLKSVHKQGPIIAKSQKLKEFFGVQSSRYIQPNTNLPVNQRGHSLDLIPSKRHQRTITPLFSERMNENKGVKRRQQFQRLYIRQKEQYQRLLKKYGIEQSVQDEQYQNFMLGQY